MFPLAVASLGFWEKSARLASRLYWIKLLAGGLLAEHSLLDDEHCCCLPFAVPNEIGCFLIEVPFTSFDSSEAHSLSSVLVRPILFQFIRVANHIFEILGCHFWFN